MKIAMLARNANLYSHRRLKEAAEVRGHQLDILNTLQPDYLAQLMAHASEQRMAADAEGN